MTSLPSSQRDYLFREAPVWVAIANMALPAVISMLVMILYNMADMFFIGRTGNTAQVAAVSLAGPVFTLMMAIGSLLGNGGSSLIAQALGAGRQDEVCRYSSVCFWASLVFGTVFGVAVLLFQTPLLGFLGAAGDTVGPARTYITILALGAPVIIFTAAFGNLIRAEGAARQAMLGNLISTLTNVLLDPLFILFFKFGVAGAAAATVLGNLTGAAYYLWYILCGSSRFSIALRHTVQAIKTLNQIAATGMPNAISNSLTGLTNALANNLLAGYGTIAVAASAASGKSTMVISMIQMGICLGVQPIMAYCCGAKQLDRLRELIGKLVVLTLSAGFAMMLLCFCNSDLVLGLFLQDKQALQLGGEMIRLRVLTGPFVGLFYIATYFLQASGSATRASVVSLLRQGIFLIPMLLVMNLFFGVVGNICAHLAADIGAATIAIILARKSYNTLSIKSASERTM